jgi:hypothetical protein
VATSQTGADNGAASEEATLGTPRRHFNAHLGTIVHWAIGECLRRADGSAIGALALRDIVIAEAMAADPLRTDRRRGLLLARSIVSAYLRQWQWPDPWAFVASERCTGRGRRTDLVFENRDTGAFVADELKTGSRPVGCLSADEANQLTVYLADLREEFGHALAGVRLVRLGSPSHSRFYSSQSDVLNEAVA